MSEAVILVTNSGLGNAEKGVREKMMGVFLSTLDTFPQLPGKILFYTEGEVIVGEVGGMAAILEAMLEAEKVLTV